MPETSATATLPSAEVYELECDVLPWARVLAAAVDWVTEHAGWGWHVVDYMCGTGRLLYDVSTRRPDLRLAGCTLDPKSYVDYANRRIRGAPVTYCDAFAYAPASAPDIILCTGGLHHLCRADQPRLIAKVAAELRPGGWFIVGEEVIGAFANEVERRRAVLELFGGLASWSVAESAPDSVLSAVMDILRNDLFERGEYKTHLEALRSMLESHFTIEEVVPVWTGVDSAERYGDYVVVCRKASSSGEST